MIGCPLGARCYDPDLEQLADIHHDHGADIIAMLEVYLDEAGTDAGSPVLCVAGYLYYKGARSKLERNWDTILDKYGIGVFHMHECKSSRCLPLIPGETEDHRKGRHDRMIRSLISKLAARAEAGFAVVLNEHAKFDQRVPKRFRSRFGGPQTMATLLCMAGVARWADCNNYQGKISYSLESGSAEQAFIDSVMRVIESDAELCELFRYHSRSSFKPKNSSRSLQTADLVAWEMQKLERGRRGHEPLKTRESMRQLINVHTRLFELDAHLDRIVSACCQYKSWEPELIRQLVPIGPPVTDPRLPGVAL